MKKISILVFALISMCTNFLEAQQDSFQKVEDESGFKSKIEAVSNSTNTIVSDFVQEKHLSFMEEGIVSSGQFYYKKDKKLRWEYSEPFNYLVILNGSQLLIDDEGRKNNIDLKSNKTYQEINDVIGNSLHGKIVSDDDRFSHELKENQKFYLIEMTPKMEELKDFLIGIDVYFDKKDLTIAKVIMHEPGEDYTQISFSNKRINEEVEEVKFSLK